MLDVLFSQEQPHYIFMPVPCTVTYQGKNERAKVATGKTFTILIVNPNKRAAYLILIVTWARSAIFDMEQ